MFALRPLIHLTRHLLVPHHLYLGFSFLEQPVLGRPFGPLMAKFHSCQISILRLSLSPSALASLPDQSAPFRTQLASSKKLL